MPSRGKGMENLEMRWRKCSGLELTIECGYRNGGGV